MATRRSAGSLWLLALVLSGPAGCGGSVAGKAGAGDRPRRPLVLTMVVRSGAGSRVFAGDVERRTRGAVRIRLVERYAAISARTSVASSERLIVGRLLSGRVQLASVPAWAWETQGVTSFRALQAPMLISDFALLRGVVTSSIADDMLRGTEARGVVGLGIVPENLRRLVARARRLVSPSAFAGARVLVRSPAMARIVRALGATPVPDEGDLSHVALQQGRVDAADSALSAVLGDGYSETARYASANVVLFPRANVIAINRKTFDRLTRTEQAALRAAARDSVRVTAAGGAEQEDAIAEVLCDLGVRFARASRGQLIELTAALRPVTAALERDPETRTFIARIAALKRATPPGPPLAIPRGCAA
jgi:TRAP-type C4-dicarboxylate transport system substrate-binding protein